MDSEKKQRQGKNGHECKQQKETLIDNLKKEQQEETTTCGAGGQRKERGEYCAEDVPRVVVLWQFKQFSYRDHGEGYL